jgi:uncharacterized protein (TIGR02145 family)
MMRVLNSMKSRTLFTITALFLAIASCKKDDKKDDTVSASLSGTLNFTMPTYVSRGSPLSLTPSGVVNPTGSVGYYWTRSWSSAKDTTKLENGPGDGTFTFTAPTEIGPYSVSCVAFAAGYYTASALSTFYVVDPALGKTITGLGINPASDPSFTDVRDGTTYFTTTVGDKVWIRSNLTYSGSGASFEGCPVMDGLFGRYYTWDEASNACPPGWHLPSDAEWAALASAATGATFQAGEAFKGAAGALMANAKFLDERMWEFWPAVNITNKTGMSIIPVGYAIDAEGKVRFKGGNDYAAFWTSDTNETNGVYRYLYVSKPDVLASYGDQVSFRASVRCVKD